MNGSPPSPTSAPRRVTQKDVAAAAHVSVMTVSYALRDSPEVSPATRQRVQAVARELGYEADPVLGALSAYRTGLRVRKDHATIVLATAWKTADAWLSVPSAQQFLDGATRRGRELGYRIEPFWVRAPGLNPRRASEILLNRGVRGLFAAPNFEPSQTPALDWKRFAVIAIEPHPDLTNYHTVRPNDFDALLKAWQAVYAAGRRRIGLLMIEEDVERVQHQWEGAFAIAQAHAPDLAARLPPLVLPGMPTEVPDPAFAAWVRQHRPDAILSRRGFVLPHLRALGLRVPADVAFASLNVLDNPEGGAGIDQNRAVLGKVAVDLMNSLLQRSHRGPEEAQFTTLVEGVWTPGWTVA